jgi:hypothetical protein
MISFNSGEKVAVVCGGEYDNTSIYIKKEEDEPEREIKDENEIFDILDDEDFNKHTYRKYPAKERLQLIKAIKLDQEPLDEYLIKKFNIMKEKVNEKLKKEFELTTGTMIPIPSKQSERIYIAGKTGSGKSCIAALYAREYNLMFPKRKIYIFTKHEKEKAYSAIPHIEITSDNEIVKEPIEVKKLSKSLVIFDDCDHIQDKIVSKNLRMLNNDIITTGRKYDIHSVTLRHILLDYVDTRRLLNEANKVIFFNSGSNYHTTRYLKVYVGLDQKQIKKITSLTSRWTMISLSLPMYVLHEHGIFII